MDTELSARNGIIGSRESLKFGEWHFSTRKKFCLMDVGLPVLLRSSASDQTTGMEKLLKKSCI